MSASNKLEKGQSIMQQLHGGEVRSEVFSTMEKIFPDFWGMTQEHLYGDIWSRPGLTLRERMIATLATLIALVDNDELEAHIRYALNIGISRSDIMEVIMHVMHYSGWPTGVNATFAAESIFFPEKKVSGKS